jgi:hypothetical protein
VACFPKDAGLDEACFKIAYDILIIGVSQHCVGLAGPRVVAVHVQGYLIGFTTSSSLG